MLLLQERIINSATEDLHIDDGPSHTRRDFQGRILNVLCLLSEDCSQQFLLRRELRFTFRGDLSYQDVTGLNPSSNPNDATLVEISKILIGHIRDLTSYLFHASLRIADM